MQTAADLTINCIFAAYSRKNTGCLRANGVEESETKIPLIFGRDVIHGHRTVMPNPLAQAASFNPELTRRAYRCVAKEAANDGLDMDMVSGYYVKYLEERNLNTAIFAVMKSKYHMRI